VISYSEAEIVFETPLLPVNTKVKPGESVDIVVLSPADGIGNSAPIAFRYARPLDVSLTVLLSSFDKKTGHVLLPIVCGRTNAPVLLASSMLETGNKELPIYSFSYYLGSSAQGAKPFKILSGASNIVALNSSLFSSKKNAADTVLVRVVVAQGESAGQAQATISRKLRPSEIGISIVPPLPAEASALDTTCDRADVQPVGPTLISGTYSSALHCPSSDSLKRRRYGRSTA
jgi:hypothetical protein